MGPCAAFVILVAAYQVSNGVRTDGARPIRLYESMRRMSPYPLDHPYAPSSFVRAEPLQPDELLEPPHASTGEALRRHLRATLPRRAAAADGTPRRPAIIEICGCGESFAPRASRALDVRRVHLSVASLVGHANALRGGRGNELANDFAQDVSGDDVLLPFADCSFDAAVLSFCAPALSRPFEVLAEINRVLAQDAAVTVALGGPLTPGRVGAMWDGMPAETQLYVVGSYFHYTDVATDGWYEELSAQHVPSTPPLLLMTGRRLGGAAYMWRRIENDRAYRREEAEDRMLDRPRGATRAPLFTAQGGVAERWLGGGGAASGAQPAHPPAARVPTPPADDGARAPVGSELAREHARAVRAAAAAASGLGVRAPAADAKASRKRILDVVQAGVQKAVERAEARGSRGEELSVAEAEVLARLRRDLCAENGGGDGGDGPKCEQRHQPGARV